MSKHSDTSQSTRRQFCLRAISVAALAPLADACGGGPNGPSDAVPLLPVVNATVANNTVSITVDANSPLASVGSAALVNYGSGAVLVARTAQTTFNAMSAVCTHQTCTITGYSSGRFICPCHGSTFDTSGHVLSGPAPRSLATLNTQFANNILTIG